MLRTIIADDEKGIRLVLKDILAEVPAVKVVLEASTGEEVLNFVKNNEVDLILFDIDMPQVDGMTAAKEIFKINPDIKMIFITAFPDYALEAFEVYSVDYILKPIDGERLKRSIELIKQNVELEELATGVAQKAVEGIISVKQKHETVFLEAEEIIMIERQNRKTLLHFPDRIFSTNEPLQEVEKRLPRYFIRTHKSFIVNVKKVSRITPWNNWSYKISFRGTDKTAMLSKHQKKSLESLIC